MMETQDRTTGAGPLRIGPYRIRSLVTSRFTLAVRSDPSGERGAFSPRAVEVVTRALLLEGAGGCTIIDAGAPEPPQGRWEAKAETAWGLSAALERAGIDPDSIRSVLLTHLHFDHVGGLAGTGLRRCEVRLSRAHLDYAQSRAGGGDAEGFRGQDLEALRERRFSFVEAGDEVLPGVHAWVSDGHTRSMLGFTIRGPEATLLVPSDLIPTISHLRLSGSGEYDLDGATLAAERRRCFEEAQATGAWIFLYHDPRHAAVRLSGTPDRPIAREEARF